MLHFAEAKNTLGAFLAIRGAIWWGTRGTCLPLFQTGEHNMPCPPTFFSLGFVFGEVS